MIYKDVVIPFRDPFQGTAPDLVALTVDPHYGDTLKHGDEDDGEAPTVCIHQVENVLAALQRSSTTKIQLID